MAPKTTALAVLEVEQPLVRPKGVTPKQWRLAALYPRAESAYQAMIQAGYTHNTSAKTASNILDRIGVKRAREAQDAAKLDSARGLAGVGKVALATIDADIKELDPRDRISVGLKATELAHQLGENVEQTGSADGWKQRLRRAIRLAYRFGYNKAAASPPIHGQDQG